MSGEQLSTFWQKIEVQRPVFMSFQALMTFSKHIAFGCMLKPQIFYFKMWYLLE
jgi:hypothetical protein